jgi:hypothetical protein
MLAVSVLLAHAVFVLGTISRVMSGIRGINLHAVMGFSYPNLFSAVCLNLIVCGSSPVRMHSLFGTLLQASHRRGILFFALYDDCGEQWCLYVYSFCCMCKVVLLNELQAGPEYTSHKWDLQPR